MCRLICYLLVTISALTLTVASYPHQQRFIQQRSGSGRSSRGFQIQNGKLSTARGFGKRGGGGSQVESHGRILSSYEHPFPKYPTAFDMEPHFRSSWPVSVDETVRDLREKGEDGESEVVEGGNDETLSNGYNTV